MSPSPVTFSKQDMLRDKIVDPGWYIVDIEDTEVGPSKNMESPSTNYTMKGVIVCNADGDTTFAGVPVIWNFNSKVKSFMIGFLRALGQEVEEDSRYDMQDFPKGKRIKLVIKVGSYDGRPRNEVVHSYAPAE